MSVSTKFSKFNSDIRISDSNKEKISSRYKQITKRLNTDFWSTSSENNHSLYVGSYGRGTDTRVSDIDMLFTLPYDVYVQYNNYNGNGQSALLQAFKKSIETTYAHTSLKADGQVVVVPFTDGITFEVVPCFINTDGSFTHPCSNNGGSWKKTNPKPEIETLKWRNVICNSNLKRLCRMIRIWKYEKNVPMGGLLIDTMAYNFICNWEHSDKSYIYYDYMIRDFFKFLKDQDPQQSYWKALGSGQFVYRDDNFEYKALVAYNKAVDACRLEAEKKTYSANIKWREIFGSKFTGQNE